MTKVKNIQFLRIKSRRVQKLIFLHFLLFTFAFLLSAPASAQTEIPTDAEPPPLKMLTKEEKTQLEGQDDIKKRTTTALFLMESRLKKAEELYAAESYSEMFVELGCFHALVDDTLNYLNRRDTGSKQVLNNYKKVELSLRAFLTRLELIRREVPGKYEFYLRGLVKTVRDARTRAVEPLFGNTVVPNEKPVNEKQ